MSQNVLSLTSHLQDNDLLTDGLKAALLEHDNDFIKGPWGEHKDNTLREISVFKHSYIGWLSKQHYIKENFELKQYY
jgi:hypothetical protein